MKSREGNRFSACVFQMHDILRWKDKLEVKDHKTDDTEVDKKAAAQPPENTKDKEKVEVINTRSRKSNKDDDDVVQKSKDDGQHQSKSESTAPSPKVKDQ